MEQNKTNQVWQEKVGECVAHPDYVAKPRGLEIREKIAGQYTVPMPAYLDLVDRKVNVNFMFAEAAWIVSGQNHLEELTPYMKAYANYSDDGVFLRGAYGPKVVDQLGYVVDTIEKDRDSRQAVMNIWRERPGPSKDIPCTLSMQFLLRADPDADPALHPQTYSLHSVVTMRSHDIVLGYTYDVFTFSMVAKAVQLLLQERGIQCELGNLTVTAGSMHIYSTHYDKGADWLDSTERDPRIGNAVKTVLNNNVNTYSKLIVALRNGADEYGETL